MPRSIRVRLVATVVLAVGVLACSGPERGTGPTSTTAPSAEDRARSGGAATIVDDGADAYSRPVNGLDSDQQRFFAVGNNLFNDNWVTAPASTEGRDGLGPVFNAQSCSSCHFRDGRARPPTGPDDPERGLLLRVGLATPDGPTDTHPTLGDQFQDRAVNGVPAEGSVELTTTERAGTFADGTGYSLAVPRYRLLDPDGQPFGPEVLFSPRIAPAVFGAGLLEAVTAEDVVALADPDDDDGDGISGRAAWIVDPATGERHLGRFGWKAAAPTVRDQTASAFRADIGITSPPRPEQPCSPVQAECLAAASGGEPEIDEKKLGRVTFYTRTLAVPARRSVGEAATDAGEELFAAVGCASCHTPELRTGPSDVDPLAGQTIHPYTDLLLHDMGPDLADGRPEGAAEGSEWRTPPLWGIGLVETVNDHTRFLHDGRARNVEEAILWHGGEAEAVRDRYRALTAAERRELLAFLDSL